MNYKDISLQTCNVNWYVCGLLKHPGKYELLMRVYVTDNTRIEENCDINEEVRNGEVSYDGQKFIDMINETASLTQFVTVLL